MTKKKTEKKAVVVTTKHRGVFFGYVADDSKAPAQITLTGVRNCVYWPATVRGFLGLSVSGPLQGSRVGPSAPEMVVYDLTGIVSCTPEAVKAWETIQWA